MMKKNQRYLLIGISIFLITVFMATASFAQKKVKLVYWTHWEQNPIFNAYYAEAGKEFAKKHPQCEGVEVVTIPFSGYEAKYLATFMARTGAPDIFNGMAHEWGGTYQFADRMPADLAKSVEENIPDVCKPVGKYAGVRYGIPIEGGNFQNMYINVEMFEEAGLDPNKPPQTFSELLDYAKKLTKTDGSGKITRSGYGIRYKGHPIGITDKFLPFLHAWGAVMVDPNFKKAVGIVDSNDGVDALTFYGDLVNKHKVSSLEVGNPEVAFSQKLAAIIFRESWFVGWLKTNSPDIRYKVYPLPAMKVAPGAGALFPWTDMVYVNSPNKKLAWDFMRFMWTKEIDLEKNMKQGIMPVWKANLESPYVKSRADYAAVLEMVKRKPAPAYYNPKANEVATAYGDAILDVIYARKNAKAALTEAAMRIERMLK